MCSFSLLDFQQELRTYSRLFWTREKIYKLIEKLEEIPELSITASQQWYRLKGTDEPTEDGTAKNTYLCTEERIRLFIELGL